MTLFRSIFVHDVNPNSLTIRAINYFKRPGQIDHGRADTLRPCRRSGKRRCSTPRPGLSRDATGPRLQPA